MRGGSGFRQCHECLCFAPPHRSWIRIGRGAGQGRVRPLAAGIGVRDPLFSWAPNLSMTAMPRRARRASATSARACSAARSVARLQGRPGATGVDRAVDIEQVNANSSVIGAKVGSVGWPRGACVWAILQRGCRRIGPGRCPLERFPCNQHRENPAAVTDPAAGFFRRRSRRAVAPKIYPPTMGGAA